MNILMLRLFYYKKGICNLHLSILCKVPNTHFYTHYTNLLAKSQWQSVKVSPNDMQIMISWELRENFSWEGSDKPQKAVW